MKQHMKFSKSDLNYFDDETKEKVVPFVIEPSFGLERTIMVLLIDAYSEEKDKEEIKIKLKLNPSIAPIEFGVFPLMKKDGLAEKAREVFGLLKKDFICEYDEAGSIGKRYARADEIGTNYCITIDYQTLKDETVTIRDRDSTKQRRVEVKKLLEILKKLVNKEIEFEKVGKAI